MNQEYNVIKKNYNKHSLNSIKIMINNQNYRNFVISFYKKKDNIVVDLEQKVNMPDNMVVDQ